MYPRYCRHDFLDNFFMNWGQFSAHIIDVISADCKIWIFQHVIFTSVCSENCPCFVKNRPKVLAATERVQHGKVFDKLSFYSDLINLKITFDPWLYRWCHGIMASWLHGFMAGLYHVLFLFLQQYLTRYGYLKPAVAQVASQAFYSYSNIVEALKAFQKFAGLGQTGEASLPPLIRITWHMSHDTCSTKYFLIWLKSRKPENPLVVVNISTPARVKNCLFSFSLFPSRINQGKLFWKENVKIELILRLEKV